MNFVWNPFSSLNGALALLSIVLGVLVYHAGPKRAENRLLALVLAAEATGAGIGGMVLYSTDSPRVTVASQLVIEFASILGMALYPLFLAHVDSPLARPFRSWWFRVTMLGVVAVLWTLIFLTPGWFVAGAFRPWYAPWEASYGILPGYYQIYGVALFLYCLALTVTAWQRAPRGTLRRKRAGAFALAFGIRDAAMALFLARLVLSDYGSDRVLDLVFLVLLPFAVLAFLLILSYGLLRFQVLDIDLRIKWTINRGTLVGVFLAVFFVVGVIAENWLTDRFGLAMGGVAAGLLLFALNPLQRFADRVSDAAMPHVRDDAEYRTVRKRDVYLAALEGAMVDGVVSDRERDMLARLQDTLGLSATDARALERGLVG